MKAEAMGVQMVAIFFVLAVLAVVALCFSHGKRRELLAQVAVALFATFSGVALALYSSARQQNAATLKRVEQLMAATREELHSSREVLEAAPNETMTMRMTSDWGRLLDQPASSLGVLLDSAAFIERAESEIVVDLMQLQKGLPWVNPTPGSSVSYSVNQDARRRQNLARITLLIDLLDIQQAMFAGELSKEEMEARHEEACQAFHSSVYKR